MKAQPMQTALLIVDVQNDFCPGGSLAVEGGDEVVGILNSLRNSTDLVIASRCWHPEQTTHFKPIGQWPPHCVAGTPGAEFHPQLKLDGAYIVSKGSQADADAYSAFDGVTDDGDSLAVLLRKLRVTTLVVGGLATDYCVEATAIDAQAQRYNVVVPRTACRSVNAERGERAFQRMKECGVVVVDRLFSSGTTGQ